MLKTQNSSGQAIVEACLSAIAISFFIKLLLIALYTGVAHLWIDYQSYEFAICESQSRRNSKTCEQRFRQRVQSLLKTGELTSVKRQKRSTEIAVEVQFKVFNQVTIERKKNLPLPLIK